MTLITHPLHGCCSNVAHTLQSFRETPVGRVMTCYCGLFRLFICKRCLRLSFRCSLQWGWDGLFVEGRSSQSPFGPALTTWCTLFLPQHYLCPRFPKHR